MAADALRNLVAYNVQMVLVAGVAAVLLRAIRIPSAGTRHACWRFALATCLGAPWLLRSSAAQPFEGPIPSTLALASTFTGQIAPAALSAASAPIPWSTLTVAVLLTGIGVRAAWLAAGLLRLRALRRAGTVVEPQAHDDLQRLLGTRATVRVLPGLSQPVTFGLVRPVVLLPEPLLDSVDGAGRRAVITHELFHVRRRDWLWVLAEELLRTLLWFQPAVWYLTSQIQHAREELVDDLTVLATGNRRAYIDALLAFADADPIRPAPAFARRARLFDRIVRLSKETAMSSSRLVMSAAVVFVALAVTGWYASAVVPIVEAAPRAQDDAATHPVTPENPIPRRVYAVAAQYPPEYAAFHYAADVETRVVLNASGSVSSLSAGAVALTPAPRYSAPEPDRRMVMDAFRQAAQDAIRQWRYEPPAEPPLAFWVTVVFRPGVPGLVSQSGAERRVYQGAPSGRAPVRVGGLVKVPVKTKDVRPVYPPDARAAAIQGVVILEVTIDETGHVADARILRSIPELDQAALDAVRRWEFTPTRLNGEPVPVIMTVTVQFTVDR